MARRRPAAVHGLVVVDKPAGVTSHDVVAQLRRRFGERQIGHAGTLDPDATGVLLVGVGRTTRLLRFLTDLGKTYTGDVVFGTTTDTLDAAGRVTAVFDMSDLTLERVRDAIAAHLVGDIMQVPPMVSALKVDGRRLHELAREGVDVDRLPRAVTVRRFEVRPTGDPLVVAIEVECSKGTYVRTLADDLGRLCGGGAHLRALRRTAVGGFTIDDAETPDAAPLRPVTDAVRHLQHATVDTATAAMVRHGRVLPRFDGEGPWAVIDEEGDLLAVYEPHGDGAKPAVVVASPSPSV